MRLLDATRLALTAAKPCFSLWVALINLIRLRRRPAEDAGMLVLRAGEEVTTGGCQLHEGRGEDV